MNNNHEATYMNKQGALNYVSIRPYQHKYLNSIGYILHENTFLHFSSVNLLFFFNVDQRDSNLPRYKGYVQNQNCGTAKKD